MQELKELKEVILSTTDFLIAYMDREFNFIEVNQAYADAGRRDRQDFIGKNHFDLYPHEENERIFRSVVESGEPFYVYAKPFDHPDQPERGTTYWDWSLKPVKDSYGKIRGLVLSLHDVTEREKAKESLRQYRRVVEGSKDLMSAIDKNYRYLFANQTYLRYHQLEEDQLVGKTVKEVLGEDVFKDSVKPMIDRCLNGESIRYEMTREYPELGERHLDVYYFPIKNEEEDIIGLAGVIRDITERKEAEEAIINERNNLFKILNSMEDGVYIVSQQYDIEFVNPALKKEFGPVRGKKCYEYLHDREEPCPWCKNEAVFKGNTVQWEWHSEKAGRTYDLIDTPIHNSDGSVSKLEIFRDITKRRQMEEELKEHRDNLEQLVEERTEDLRKTNRQLRREIEERKKTEERIKHLHRKNDLILNSVGVGIYELDLEGKTTFVNNAAVNLTGYNSEELIGQVHHSILHHSREDGSPYPQEECPINKTLKDGVTRHITEDVFWKKDDSLFPIEYVVTPVEENKGISGAVVVFRDLTDIKQKEEEIRRLSTAVEHTKDSIIIMDRDGYVLEANDSTLDLFGIDPKGKKFSDLVDSRDRKKAEAAISNLSQNNSIKEEYYISREDNRAIESNMSPIGHGNPTGYVIISRDISERKKAEEELKKKLMKYNLEEGMVYLEGSFDRSLEAFQELTNVGYNGLIISRTPKEKMDTENYEFWWIAQKGGIPDLEDLEGKIDNLPKKYIILLDRLDYLISRNGFDRTLSFIYDLREIAYLKDSIVILVLDPLTLDDRQLALIRKETHGIEPRSTEKVPDDLLNILKYVYSQNRLGVKPCYTEICSELNMSKPTIRKKLRSLVNEDYLSEDYDGRHKRVEITEKTRDMFFP
ncbi:MAG: PAS domain S-box protein [Archaeoglobaceae archaeon]